MGHRWHIVRDGAQVTLARHLPVRIDVAAHTTVPWGAPIRYAHQIRQDLWRCLRNVRGFSPVVRLSPDGEGWRVQAGGRLAGTGSQALRDRIAELLEESGTRQRWIAQAQRKGKNR